MSKCTLCGNKKNINVIYEVENVFVSSDLFDMQPYNSHQRHYAKGTCDIQLCQCSQCGFLFNNKFNLDEIIKAYSSTKYYQQKNFTDQLSKHILDTAKKILSYINDKKDNCIAEIASGQGDLLRALSKHVGFIYSIDPSPISNNIKNIQNVEHVQTFFDYESMKKRVKKDIDLIICRHVIEHIGNPGDVLRDIVKLLNEDGILYIEVPDIVEIIKNMRYYELYHDHCGYYQPSTIIKFMEEIGCEFLERVTYFNEQHQGFFFKKKVDVKKTHFDQHCIYDKTIGDNFKNICKKINVMLEKYNSVAIYGAGVHANTFINLISEGNLRKICRAFDANSEKHGKFLQNSNIMICEPTEQNLKDIDCIIMIMPICEDVVYENEIKNFINTGIFSGDVIKTVNCSLL
ncbi:TPA: class I SAM-dependent methyltransferase [Campylobacter lari]|nr:class I SAM-dependent methyltransferase [Campylobacter lari]